ALENRSFLEFQPFCRVAGHGLFLLGSVAVGLLRTLVAALVVPTARVDLALDLVRLHGRRVGLHVGLLHGLPRIARITLTEAPLTRDLVSFTLFGNAVDEVAFALAVGLGADLADFVLGPGVAEHVAVDLALQLAVSVTPAGAPSALRGLAVDQDVQVAVGTVVVHALPLALFRHLTGLDLRDLRLVAGSAGGERKRARDDERSQ